MSVQYERDDTRRRLIVTVTGPLLTSDLLAVIERQRLEDTRSYGLLYDLRRMTGRTAIAELRKVLDQAAVRPPGEQPRGPVAVVTTDPVMYGIACKYAAMGRFVQRVEVFRVLDEANRWLDAETGPS